MMTCEGKDPRFDHIHPGKELRVPIGQKAGWNKK
jgi:hypothetical protein